MNSAMLLPWVALLTPLTVIGWTLGSQRGRRRRLDRWFGATLLSFAALALLDLWSPSSTLDPDTLTVVSHVAYQLMALGVILFLLHTVQGLRPLQLGWWGCKRRSAWCWRRTWRPSSIRHWPGPLSTLCALRSCC